MLEIVMLVLLLIVLAALAWLIVQFRRSQGQMSAALNQGLEARHRLMLSDLHQGLNQLGDRMIQANADSAARLRDSVTQELTQTRDAVQTLQLAQHRSLSDTREAILTQLAQLSAELQIKQDALRVEIVGKTLETLAEQGRADQAMIQTTMLRSTESLTQSIAGLTQSTAAQLEKIAASVAERLAAGFKQTNETFAQVTQGLNLTREAMQALQLAQQSGLATTREALLTQLAQLSAGLQAKQEEMRIELVKKTLETLAEQGRADQALIQGTMQRNTEMLTLSITGLTQSTDMRLEQISGKVAERLDEGFKKTNETFTNVMTRLATIDEAQKKIDGLTTNVVSLQALLGDKRSRGAFGEVQLEGLVRNILPPDSYRFQEKLSNGSRVDCLLILPSPTGNVPVDAKFPLENYHRMLEADLAESDKQTARKQFKLDIRKHIDDISSKYLIKNETSDGAVMFLPAEAVFAEIHAYHGDLVEYAMQKHIWIVSPTTLMAVLNTARAVMKDVKMREQVHIIQTELGKLSKDFTLFDTRMKKLADNIRRANDEVSQVEISSRKISSHFAKIEAVEMLEEKPLPIVLQDEV
ncbi:MAG: DNA recombination protein RmuC [Gallionella sp.]